MLLMIEGNHTKLMQLHFEKIITFSSCFLNCKYLLRIRRKDKIESDEII